MKKLLFILLISMLTGCTWFKKSSDIITNTEVVIDNSILNPCDKLPELLGGDPIIVLDHHLEVIRLYGKCSDKQEASATLIRKLTNKEKKN